MSSEYANYIKARVSAQELAEARRIAEREGKTISQMIREAIWGHEVMTYEGTPTHKRTVRAWETRRKNMKARNAGEKETGKA